MIRARLAMITCLMVSVAAACQDAPSGAVGTIRQLTFNRVDDFHPSFSADGKWIVWDTVIDSAYAVAVMPAAGGRPRVIARGDHPVWFSGTDSILYQSRTTDGQTGTWLTTIEGGSHKVLIERSGQTVPDPHGSRLAYLTRDDGAWTVNLRTDTGDRRITGNDSDDLGPVWSPEGQLLAFMSKSADDWDIEILDVKNGSLRQIRQTPANESTPAWSPDGQHLAYLSDATGRNELYRVSRDGLEDSRLTSIGVGGWYAWAGDGSEIVFVDAHEDLYLLEVSTLLITPLVVHEGRDVAPAVSPDGHTIVFVSDRDGDLELFLYERSID